MVELMRQRRKIYTTSLAARNLRGLMWCCGAPRLLTTIQMPPPPPILRKVLVERLWSGIFSQIGSDKKKLLDRETTLVSSTEIHSQKGEY